MTSDEIRQIVRAVFDEESERHVATVDATVAAILFSFGIGEDERKDLPADFRHLRKWRKSVEQVEAIGWKTAITVVVTGTLGAMWIGFKTLLGK